MFNRIRHYKQFF